MKRKITALLLTVLMLVSVITPLTLTSNAASTLLWPVPGHFALSRGYSSSHGAMDVNDSNIKGANIVAVMGGTIVRISKCTVQHYEKDCSCGGTGTGVVIKGTDNRYYSYAHMIAGSIPSSFVVNKTTVKAGDVIGRVGTTGNSSGPHLHFSIATGSDYLDNRIDPEYETYTNVGATAFSFATLPSKMSVSNTDATIAVTLSKPAYNRLIKYGATVYDNNGVVVGTASEASSGQKGVSNASLWWTVSSSMGTSLQPGRTYYYTFWANVSGVTLTSPKYSFTTTGTAGASYSFSYDGNGASGSIANNTVYFGSKIPIAENTFTREGYDFAGYYTVKRSDGKCYVTGTTTGWFTESDITANGYTKKQYKPGESYNVSNAWTEGLTTQFSYTFYAQWVPATYDILTYRNYTSKNYLYDSAFTEGVNSTFWQSRDTSVATVGYDSSVKRVSEYNTLKIVNTQAGASSGSKDLAIGTLTNRSKTKNSAVGDSKEMILSFWAKASASGTKMYFRWGYETTYKSVTLTDDWAYYTVRLDKTELCGNYLHPYVDKAGTVWISEMQLEDGTEATEFVNETGALELINATYEGTYSNLPTPERDGYTFDGWYTEMVGGTKITASTSVLPYGMALYAHWTKKQSAVYDINGDGKFNMFDYVAVKSACLNGTGGEELLSRADVNGDGKVNMFDYVVVKNSYFVK